MGHTRTHTSRASAPQIIWWWLGSTPAPPLISLLSFYFILVPQTLSFFFISWKFWEKRKSLNSKNSCKDTYIYLFVRERVTVRTHNALDVRFSFVPLDLGIILCYSSFFLLIKHDIRLINWLISMIILLDRLKMVINVILEFYTR